MNIMPLRVDLGRRGGASTGQEEEKRSGVKALVERTESLLGRVGRVLKKSAIPEGIGRQALLPVWMAQRSLGPLFARSRAEQTLGSAV